MVLTFHKLQRRFSVCVEYCRKISVQCNLIAYKVIAQTLVSMFLEAVLCQKFSFFFCPGKPQVQVQSGEHFSLRLTSTITQRIWKAITYCSRKGQK